MPTAHENLFISLLAQGRCHHNRLTHTSQAPDAGCHYHHVKTCFCPWPRISHSVSLYNVVFFSSLERVSSFFGISPTHLPIPRHSLVQRQDSGPHLIYCSLLQQTQPCLVSAPVLPLGNVTNDCSFVFYSFIVTK